jgi:predicted RNA polymerase sigma factor
MTEAQLRELIPGVLAALVHRGADFATAEDAVQESLIRAVEVWPNQYPDDPKGWLITTAWRPIRRPHPIRHRPAPPRGPGIRGTATRTGRLRR